MSSSLDTSNRVTHQGDLEYEHPQPTTLLQASTEPPQYPVTVNRKPEDPIAVTYPVSRMHFERQKYPVVNGNPTVGDCVFYGTRWRDWRDIGIICGFLMGTQFFAAFRGKRFSYEPIMTASVLSGMFAPLMAYKRGYDRLMGLTENVKEQELYRKDTSPDSEVVKIVRKRVFQSKEDDEKYMDRHRKRVDNPTYLEMKALLKDAPVLEEKMKADGLTPEDFTYYPSEQIHDKDKREFYKTLVGNSPELQRIILQNPHLVKHLNNGNAYLLQEIDHGNRYLAKFVRIWNSKVEQQRFLQSRPAYIANFMQNKISWDDIVSDCYSAEQV